MTCKDYHRKGPKLSYAEWCKESAKLHELGKRQIQCPSCRLWIWETFWHKKQKLGKLIAILLLTAFSVYAERQAHVTWSPSPESDIGGYVAYVSTNQVDWIDTDVGNQTNIVWGGLIEGTTYWFSAIAYNTNGMYSEMADPVSLYVPLPPTQPRNVTVTLEATSILPATNWVNIGQWVTNETGETYYRLKIQ